MAGTDATLRRCIARLRKSIVPNVAMVIDSTSGIDHGHT